ncbi:MAG: alanine racemase, partial [Planctomycetota bacterium]
MDDSWFQIKNIDEIPSPTVLVYPDRIAANLQAMIESVDDPRRLRPHVKTHKMSQIVRMKLDAGITKFKTATIAETEMVLDAGGRDVLLAMQCVGPNLGRLITLMRRFPDATITSLVDHQSTLNHFHKIAIANKVRLRLMIDLNVGMDRTGIAPGDDALELLRTMCALPGIIPAGLHAYDGHLRDADDETLEHQVEAAFEPVWRLRDRCRQAGMTIDRVVASGTPTSHLLARYDDVEVSAGTTVLWDAGQLQVTPSLPYQVAAVV